MVVYDWISAYKVGLVESLEESGGKGTKALKICQVNIGGEDTIQVVTSAPNVRLESRLAVAPIGSTVLGSNGEGMKVTKTSVGGVTSEGIFCDSRMLEWEGGSVGIAAQMDKALALGSQPPSHKPRPENAVTTTELPESTVEGLFKKKLSKEEKKKINDEKKRARKAAKEAKKAAEEGGGD
jgi:tRNA-binding EMAP/Myf-like protein